MTPDTVARPPWPDELPRITAAFPDTPLAAAGHPLVLVTTPPEERIVGFAHLVPHTGAAGAAASASRLHWQVRPRFAKQAPEFLAAVVAHAAHLGVRAVEHEEDVAYGTAESPALQQAGFICIRQHHLWGIPIAAAAHPHSAAFERIVGRTAAADLKAEPIGPDLDEAVVAFVVATGLLPPERIRFASDRSPGFDRQLSSVVLRDRRVLGVMLVRRERHYAVVEVRATAPEHVGHANIPNALLLRRLRDVAAESGVLEAILTADPAAADETIRFARKSGGSHRRTARLWRWQATA